MNVVNESQGKELAQQRQLAFVEVSAQVWKYVLF
jgi:hypothetical protein